MGQITRVKSTRRPTARALILAWICHCVVFRFVSDYLQNKFHYIPDKKTKQFILHVSLDGKCKTKVGGTSYDTDLAAKLLNTADNL